MTIANNNISSTEEQEAARYLRNKNLKAVNESSAPVIPNNSFYVRHVKRWLDVAIALPVFIVVLPVNLIIGVCTLFDVGRPLLFKQDRVGKNGKLFHLVKFRNMRNDTDEDGYLLPPSQRVTKFGKLMRKTSLDELLNLWSIIKGDMSIIGPRPQPVVLHERLSERHKARIAVRPGLECPRMIHVPGEEVCLFQRTFENDVWYVENVSFALDVKMLWHLVRMVFASKKRTAQATGEGISYFIGYNDEGIAVGMKWWRENQKKLR